VIVELKEIDTDETGSQLLGRANPTGSWAEQLGEIVHEHA